MAHTERKHCFGRGGWDALHALAVVQFSDGAVYAYDGLTEADFLTWRDDACRGCHFNSVYRWSDVEYHRLSEFPEGLIETFEDPEGLSQ